MSGSYGTPLRDTDEFRRGRTGEQLVAHELQRRGWFVLPSYDYTGEDDDKAPRLQGLEVSYVVPDLDVCKAGRRRWVEVKTKRNAVEFRKTRTMVHGIPLRHWQDYWAVQNTTGSEVWLCIYEEHTHLAMMRTIRELAPAQQTYTGDKMSRGGMVFFPRDEFRFTMALEVVG